MDGRRLPGARRGHVHRAGVADRHGREHGHERREHVRGRHDRAGGGDHGPGRRLADQRRDARHHRHRRHRRGRRGHGDGASSTQGQVPPARRSRRSPRPWAVAAAGRSRPPHCRRAPTRCRRPRADTAGNTGTSTARTFTVDTTPPAVTLTAPADGSRTNDTTPTYSRRRGQRDRRQRVGDGQDLHRDRHRRHARADAHGDAQRRDLDDRRLAGAGRRAPTRPRRRRPTTPATPARARRARSRSTPPHPPSRSTAPTDGATFTSGGDRVLRHGRHGDRRRLRP